MVKISEITVVELLVVPDVEVGLERGRNDVGKSEIVAIKDRKNYVLGVKEVF